MNVINTYLEALVADCIVLERDPTQDARWPRVLAGEMTDEDREGLQKWFGQPMPPWGPIAPRRADEGRSRLWFDRSIAWFLFWVAITSAVAVACTSLNPRWAAAVVMVAITSAVAAAATRASRSEGGTET